MKTLLSCSFVLVALLSSGASNANQTSCAQLVHDRTMAPLNELSTLAPNGNGLTTVIRHKDTSYVLFDMVITKGKIESTTFQCDGKGNYRQLLETGWSIWRTGKEWNAIHWMKF